MTADLSLRMRELHQHLANIIPCFPDEEWVRKELRAIHLGEALLVYLNWMSRMVAPRQRTVSYTDVFWDAPQAKEHEVIIREIEALVIAGANIEPFLSEGIRTGYVGSTHESKKQRKHLDFALNAYSVHHLHLSDRIRKDGMRKRTQDLLYVAFSRTEALFIMVGNHKSFDDDSLNKAIDMHRARELSLEVPRSDNNYSSLRELERRGISTMSSVGGKVFMKATLTTAGTSTWTTMHGIRALSTIRDYDAKLDEVAPTFFAKADTAMPDSPQYEWVMDYCDLYLVERTTAVRFLMVPWWQ